MYEEFINKAREIYSEDYIPLHRPIFNGNEQSYVAECIESNFVSSVGKRVVEFEEKIAEYTGSKFAVATSNGTSALHIALQLAGVRRNDEVITQALTFIATCNAISYIGADPVFVDVDIDTMGMSAIALEKFLELNYEKRKNQAFNKKTGKKLSACVPMHTFGFPCRIEEIADICSKWRISLIEDSAESLGSFVNKIHTGNFGKMGILSFNGNKILTTGGGGMIITNDEALALQAKHITTTAKVTHKYKFVHDQIGYNYRMPNLNAALGCAQLEQLENFLLAKKAVTNTWKDFFNSHNINFFALNDKNYIANNWLNTVIMESQKERDSFLEYTNNNKVMTRPAWELMSSLQMFKSSEMDALENSSWLYERIVNIPSSVPR